MMSGCPRAAKSSCSRLSRLRKATRLVVYERPLQSAVPALFFFPPALGPGHRNIPCSHKLTDFSRVSCPIPRPPVGCPRGGLQPLLPLCRLLETKGKDSFSSSAQSSPLRSPAARCATARRRYASPAHIFVTRHPDSGALRASYSYFLGWRGEFHFELCSITTFACHSCGKRRRIPVFNSRHAI